jgi:hypothetical protein
MKLLYMLVCPSGAYHPNRYDPSRSAVPPPRRAPSSEGVSSAPAERPPRIDPVVPARFQRGKLLGQGGQGTVYAGAYDGYPCAGKVAEAVGVGLLPHTNARTHGPHTYENTHIHRHTAT